MLWLQVTRFHHLLPCQLLLGLQGHRFAFVLWYGHKSASEPHRSYLRHGPTSRCTYLSYLVRSKISFVRLHASFACQLRCKSRSGCACLWCAYFSMCSIVLCVDKGLHAPCLTMPITHQTRKHTPCQASSTWNQGAAVDAEGSWNHLYWIVDLSGL